MTNVALYIRVSTQEQARHGLSLSDQREALERYAESHEMRVVGVYEDAGISARKSYKKRPALSRLLEDCKNGGVNLILFIKLDRWFRNVADYYEVQKVLDAHNVAWQAINEDYETVTASGRFKVNIMLSVAQDEADRTSERIKFVFEGKVERNEAMTHTAPLGYKIVDKHIEIDEAEAETVRAMFDVYLRSGSLADVRAEFPEYTLPYKTLYRMFHSERYLGKVCGVQAPAIITQEQHERALSFKGKAPRRTVEENRVYLFAGLLKCPYCGGSVVGTCHIAYGHEYFYYRCCSHRYHHGCTNKRCYPEAEIENYLLDHLETEVNVAALNIKKEPDKRTTVKRTTLERKLVKLSDLYLSDLITKDDYTAKYKALTAQIAALPPEIPQREPPKLPTDWRNIYNSISRKGKQTFWHGIIESVTLNDESVDAFSLR